MISKQGKKFVECKKCFTLMEVSEEAKSGICWRCLQSMVDFPEEKTAVVNKSRKPKGWQLMKIFVTKDGTVYEKGKENPKLKGKYPPTDVKAILKERSKRKREQKKKEEKEIAKRNKHLTDSGYAKKVRKRKK